MPQPSRHVGTGSRQVGTALLADGLPQQERLQLVALFNAERYGELEIRARLLVAQHPDSGFAWQLLGASCRGQGKEALPALQRAAELLPEDAEVYSNLGVVLQELGRLESAVASYLRALEIKPDFAGAHYNLANTLRNLGRLDNAVASYHRALEIRPDFVEGLGNLGDTLFCLGRLQEAETSYRRALKIKPDYAEAHSNLGITLRNQGRLQEAEASYRRAIEIAPNFANAHSNLANVLRDQGRLDAAEASCRRALLFKPDFAEAHCNLALLLIAQDKPMPALQSILQSLHIKETAEARKAFVDCVKRLRITQADTDIRAFIIRALSEPWSRPSELARTCIDFIKLDQEIGAGMARTANAWPVRLSAEDLLGPDKFDVLARNALLCALLESVPTCDVELERFLTNARHAMLEAAIGKASDEDIGPALVFYSALARQCFINEYVFSHTDDEFRKASDLRDSLVAALEAKTRVPILWLVAVAAYFPLCTLPLAARLLQSQWQDAVTAVLVQQVREPEEELRLRTTIPCLAGIDNEVSLLVRNQYELNPYPRWTKAAPVGQVSNVVGYLRQKFPRASFVGQDQSCRIDVMIAGCGTGQHSIRTAQQFQGAQVLAIDLSISSLSYAKRKTAELGLTSIDYAQADLLQVGSLGRSFDVIESVGVLHHLDDPLAGWRVLLSLLRPGGFMRLGFYSEIARRNIVIARKLIAEKGYGTTADEIRRFRQELVGVEESPDFGTIMKSPDFFSISTCRDLLFHVQEHRMTLTGIDTFLRSNNLAFLGFELDDSILLKYRQRFPDDPAATNLAKWNIFENEYPDTSLGMYQFWVQKSL